jgi:predicted DNA-binding ribbon-helix-helix protein
MHRTQLILETWQYEALKARAEARGLSLSALVREILAESLETPHHAALESLRRMRGIAGGTGDLAERHDDLLYPVEGNDKD